MMIPGLLMAVGYASLLVRLGEGGALILRALRCAGRSAFTLYLSQSVVMVGVFSYIVPGAWGALSRGEYWLVVAAYSGVQLVVATWWQTRLGRMPMERLWRFLAYRPLNRA
jgi:uncharacterized protein